jgi:hypothetical protein
LDERIVDTFVLVNHGLWLDFRTDQAFGYGQQKADTAILPALSFYCFGSALCGYRSTAFDCAGMCKGMPGTASFALRMTAGCERSIERRICNSRKVRRAMSITATHILIRLLKAARVVDEFLEIEWSSIDVFAFVGELSGYRVISMTEFDAGLMFCSCP